MISYCAEYEESVDIYGSFHIGRSCCICHGSNKMTFKLCSCREEEEYDHFFCENCIRLMFNKLQYYADNDISTTEYYCSSCLTLINTPAMVDFINACKDALVLFRNDLIVMKSVKPCDIECLQESECLCHYCSKLFPKSRLLATYSGGESIFESKCSLNVFFSYSCVDCYKSCLNSKEDSILKILSKRPYDMEECINLKNKKKKVSTADGYHREMPLVSECESNFAISYKGSDANMALPDKCQPDDNIKMYDQ